MANDWVKGCALLCNGTRDYSNEMLRVFISNKETEFPVGQHSHTEYEFMFLKSQSIITVCNGKRLPIEKGYMMPFNSLDVHGQDYAVKVEGFVCIACNKSLMEEVCIEAYGDKTVPVFANKGFKPSSRLHYYLGNFIDENNAGDEGYCKALLSRLIIIEIIRCSENNILTVLGDKANSGIMRAIKFIKENYNASFDLDKLAEIAGMTKYYFIKKFLEQTNLSPLNYYLNTKIEKAKNMITEKEKNLTDIAYDLGFSSQSHFCMQFKKHTGITPGEYRKKIVI